MSKIAEQKASEAYPNALIGNLDNLKKDGFIKGYDQAIRDFLEKAEKFFKNEFYVSVSDQICSINNFTSMSNFIEQFKNYMQNESEN